MTTTLSAPVEQTTQAAFISDLWALRRAFNKAESAGLIQAINDIALSLNDTAETRAMIEDQEELGNVVREALDRLVAKRLVANKRNVPLLTAGDVESVIADLMMGEAVDETFFTTMALLRPIAERAIVATIRDLEIIDSDMYAAFWRFIAALMSAAAAGSPPHELIEFASARAVVYRLLMTRADWRKLGATSLAIVAGLDLSGSGTTAALRLLDDDSAEAYRQAMVTAQPDAQASMKSFISVVRKYYTTRAREIWPAPSSN